MGKKIDRTGEINISNEGYEMKIIKYFNWENVIVEFQDKNKIRVTCRYNDFKKGSIKNPYHTSICKKGYLGVGKYSYKTHSQIYKEWNSMLHRCYDNDVHKIHSTYTDCTVCEEWLNFQNFAKWYEENYYEIEGETMCLDKDILIKGNKVYSPSTCIFVPNKINALFTKSDKARGKYPIGVSFHKKYNKLIVRCNINNKTKHLGMLELNQVNEAFLIYKNFKENYIKQVADEYKDLIPIKLYDAMYKYEVEITD